MRAYWTLAIAICLSTSLLLITTLSAQDQTEAGHDADFGISEVDVASYPDLVRDGYGVLTDKCGQCHAVARPINTSMGADAWKATLHRMADKPGANLSPNECKRVYRFVRYREQARLR